MEHRPFFKSICAVFIQNCMYVHCVIFRYITSQTTTLGQRKICKSYNGQPKQASATRKERSQRQGPKAAVPQRGSWGCLQTKQINTHIISNLTSERNVLVAWQENQMTIKRFRPDL